MKDRVRSGIQLPLTVEDLMHEAVEETVGVENNRSGKDDHQRETPVIAEQVNAYYKKYENLFEHIAELIGDDRR